jgi:hypothetical protein
MTHYVLKGVTERVVIPLGSGVNTLGRSEENSAPLSESSVSSHHCEIHIVQEGVFVRDLQSTNGTFLNDVPVTEAWIQQGQILQLGSLRLVLETETVDIRVPDPVAPGPAEPIEPARLPDGSLACARQPHLPAAFRCSKCNKPFHGSSLRQVRMSAGKLVLLFCPECDGKCEVIPGFGTAKAQGGAAGLLKRISQTIQLGWKKPKS